MQLHDAWASVPSRNVEFIEFRLFWEGGVNRSDIVDEFGVSVPQASKDLSLYQEQAPDNIRYDRSQKRYFASAHFQPAFISLDADAYLGRLAADTGVSRDPWNDSRALSVVSDEMPVPHRAHQAWRSSCVAGVCTGGSLNRGAVPIDERDATGLWRRISPHAFGNDGLRWHARAFCHIDQKFKDFILSRCVDTRAPDEAGALPGRSRRFGSRRTRRTVAT